MDTDRQEQILERFAQLDLFQRKIREAASASEAIQIADNEIGRIYGFHSRGFYLVNPADGAFELFKLLPEAQYATLAPAVARAIRSGAFAWALKQQKALFWQDPESGCELMLQSLSTRERTLGMFAGLSASASPKGARSIVFTQI